MYEASKNEASKSKGATNEAPHDQTAQMA
jgi:hypothetical protein